MRSRMLSSAFLICALHLLVATGSAFAFLGPIDTAGPLTARIEGPEEVTESETPLPMAIVLENTGETALKGTVRLEVIDQWRVTPPEPVAFEVEGNGSARLSFTATAGMGTYNALYPIHAYVEFEADGKAHMAHPILILKTHLPDPPEPDRFVAWEPVPVRPDSVLALWRQPAFRVVTAEFDGPSTAMVPGWQGAHDGNRANVIVGASVVCGTGRAVVQMHPPWANGRKGSVWTEFPVQLPEGQPVVLRFANAIRDHDVSRNEPPSDGVTFHVRVAPFDAPEETEGQLVFERHTDAKVWEQGEVDLSAFAGQAVRIQLECHPGPKNDCTCDQAYWAEPTLIVGTPPPPSSPGAQTLLLSGKTALADESHTFTVSTGSRGLLDGKVAFQDNNDELSFSGFAIRAGGDSLADVHSVATLLDVKTETGEHGPHVRHSFDSPAGTFDLLGEVWADGPALRMRFWLENEPEPKPWHVVYLEEVSLGPWNQNLHRLYAGPGNVIENPEAFTVGFDGHRIATSFVGYEFTNGPSLVQAVDVPPSHLRIAPGERIATFETAHAQTITLIPTSNVWEGAKAWRAINGLKAAAGVGRAAGRFVFDLWGGQYSESAEALEKAFQYGLTDAMVVWHSWQRWGYDYRLPDICPPNPRLGTEQEFKDLIQTCKARGVVFVPHDNYIDFYPDADGYSYEHIAFTNGRRPIPGWLNKGRDAQAYRWRVDHIQPFLERNVNRIKRDYAPTGFFIDVWSSACPYDYWSHDGRFFDRIYTRNTWGEFFAWIRDQLGDNAPQIGESGHDQLIGWLDGAQTNHLRVDPDPNPNAGWMVWRVQCDDAERIPWFDAAHHDRFILHGAGYSNRYAGGLNGVLHGIYSDDYVATEVLTGHPAMVPSPFGRDVVRKYWLLHDIMRGLALQRIESVEFVDNNLHRQHVRWNNGAEVWVNRGETDWATADNVLPQYGFFARVPVEGGDAEAAIERLDGVIVEWSHSPGRKYVNARPVVDHRAPVTVALDSLEVTGDKTLDVHLAWDAKEPLKEELRIFVHLVDENGAIVLQGDHDPTPPTNEWQGIVKTTGHVPLREDADWGKGLRLHVGLYDAKIHRRVAIRGRDVGGNTIDLGSLRLVGEGARLVGEGARLTGVTREPFQSPEPDILTRLNPDGKPIDFGEITADGACRLAIEGDTLIVTPLPDSPAFTVHIAAMALRNLGHLTTATPIAEGGTPGQPTPLEQTGAAITLQCEPGVFAYRLKP